MVNDTIPSYIFRYLQAPMTAKRMRVLRSEGYLLSFLGGRSVWIAGIMALLVAGCGNARQTSVSSSQASEPVEDILRMLEQEWHGSPYQYGGDSKSGIDQSTFVTKIFESAFGIALPKTIMEQVKIGDRVAKRSLRAGDLVFFRTSDQDRHVGIYLSGGEFAHVSPADGVRTSRLDESIWQTAYWTAQRVLPATLATPVETTRQPSRKRTGW